MATTSNAPTGSAIDIGVNDLGPLAWVLDELRKSLDSAAKALKRFVRDADIAKGSDLNAADASQLRIARQQLHQSVGALEMVGFTSPASMLRGMEGAVQKFVAKPELCTEAAAVKVERASFALLGYLEALLVGKSPSAVELFSQYAEVQELAGATRVHPADLWAVPWRWRDLEDTGVPVLELDANFRARFDKSALMVVKVGDTAACAELAQQCAGLANQSAKSVDAQFRTFWRIAAGTLEAIATGSLQADLHVKRTVSRLLILLATHTKGDMSVPERLAQDLLFFCAQASPKGMTPLLGEVRMVYGLASHIPVDYTKSFYGQFDPSLLVQARKRIGQLKESWSSFTAGELSKAKPVQDQMALLIDSIGKLLPASGQSLIAALNEVVDSTARQQKPPEATLGMEVATAILYLEATFEDFDPEDKQQANRIAHLAQRVQMARGGAAGQPLESWMEELYRRVSDRQTMGSVVGELKLTLGELEKVMDAFFRDPQDKVLLNDVPSRLTQMRGVLAVLGLDQASLAVMRMRESVENILVTEVDEAQARAAGTFEKLGNNLGALGFLIDMLSYQPVLAKKLFVYEEATGELKPLMGRSVPEEQASVASTSANFNPEATIPMATASSLVATTALNAHSSSAAAPAVAVVVDAAEVDPELLDIFLEEAREVAGNGLAATQALTVEPNNIGEMTTLRRAFHTLKGSSRMVGLNVFGEAAWSMEQVLNSWLADQKPASPDLCALSTQALHAQQIWIEEIAAGGGKHRTSVAFRTSADAMRTSGQLLPIVIEQPAPLAATPAADTAGPVALELASADMLSMELPTPVKTEVLDALDAPVALDLPEFTLPELTLPELSIPVVTAAAVSTVLPTPDFSLHLGDLDSALAMPAEPAMLEPEPFVTIATPVQPVFDIPVVMDTPALTPSSEPDLDLMDFQFDDAFITPEISAVAATPAVDAPASNALTADAGSSVDWSALTQPIATTQMPEEPAAAVTEQDADALVTAEELAAFEQAMMAMDNAPAEPAEQAPPFDMLSMQIDSPIEASEQSISIDAIDLQALQNLAPTDLPATPMAFGATSLATTFQTTPQSLTSRRGDEEDSAAYTSMATVPASLSPIAPPSSPSDLGIDLGLGFSSISAPASSASSGELNWLTAGAVSAVAAVGVGAVVASKPALKSVLAERSISPASAGGYAAEEQFKAIGPLRVSLPLYNVYLNEADEWSRRLANGLAEWAMEPHAKLHNDAIAFSHSLAGSSATVGFSALSGLARSLENTLTHMQRIEEDGDYDPHSHASLFVNAAEEIRHLLHQFAAGILKDGSPQIEAELARCMQAPFPAEETTVTESDAFSELFFEASDAPAPIEPAQSAPELIAVTEPTEAAPSPAPMAPAAEPTVSWATPQVLSVGAAAVAASSAAIVLNTESPPATSAAVEVKSAPEVVAIKEAVNTPLPAAASLKEAPVLAVRSRQIAQDEIDDEIDAVDALDPDLFEIFEEEAQEIFPATASALRQWAARPDNMSARGEVLRGLHTLKGSARLAGAMRLGELSHRMESSVENIPHEGARSADIEQLMALLDGMQHNFDVLRNPALAAEQARPTAQSAANPVATAAMTSATPMAPLRPMAAATGIVAPAALRSAPGQTVRVRAQLLDRLMNQAGEVMITRSRLEAELSQLRGSLTDLGSNLEKLRSQLRELDVQAESQMQTRLQQTKETEESFDPLEFDRYTRVQELTRMMAESVNDVATVQRNIQRTIESTEDDLVMQARQTRDLQRDLLRTRMVEFEGISERLYRVVRQASKDAGKQVKLDILGGTIEMDRGVLDRMTPAFEHLLRNCVAHGIETAEARAAAGKAASGEIVITLHQEGNDVSIEFRDDGAGLNIARIREKAISQGLLGHDAPLADNDAANLIFTPGFSTAATITELSGRGVGMDVVRSEVVALGGRIETSTSTGQGTSFKLVLPLTTAVTQVVMMRIGQLSIGVPANLIEIVRRATPKELQSSYNSGTYEYAGESLPFFWAGALLQHSSASSEPVTKTLPMAVFRSAAQRVALHIDEVLGNQEVVVKNLGPQLSRLPGLAGMTVLASGAVALIYNPVALATVYGSQARAMSFDPAQPHALEGQAQMKDVSDAVPRELSGDAQPVVPLVPANPASISPPAIPMVLVVDDSITVRRVTQRLLQREGYRVTMAADGLQALERLAEELPSVILSDIEMPRMDGFDLLRNVRGDAKLKHLPTIMITSRIAEKHREYAFELGANHYLGKPYNEEELLSLIRRYAREEVTV